MKLIRRGLAIIALGLTALMLTPPSLSFASAPPPVTTDTTSITTFVVAAPVVSVIIGFLIPVLNGLLTTRTTASWVKGVGTIVLNAVAALLTNGLIADGSSAFSSSTLYTAILGVLVSTAAYANIWRPLNITSTPQLTSGGTLIEGRLADKGIA